MVRLMRLTGDDYILEGDEIIRGDVWTPMDWDYVTQRLDYRRRMMLRLSPAEANYLSSKLTEDTCLYRMLSHEVQPEPKCPWKGDSLYEATCVQDDTGYYVDDYGLRVFCTTRLSQSFHDDIDMRSDDYDYLRETISAGHLPRHGVLAGTHVRLRV